jgi:hypothetical protein
MKLIQTLSIAVISFVLLLIAARAFSTGSIQLTKHQSLAVADDPTRFMLAVIACLAMAVMGAALVWRWTRNGLGIGSGPR